MTSSATTSTQGYDAPPALTRALPLLRLPSSPDAAPRWCTEEAALECPRTGTRLPWRSAQGFLDLLSPEFRATPAQKSLDTPVTAWAYDHFRPFAHWAGMRPFAREVDDLVCRLAIEPGSTILDLACGQGNFTVALADRVSSDGLVIGVDIARSMLRRAARHVARAGLDNVLLVRADALDLPIADGAFARINCSGGLHQLPDLSRAAREMARVASRGGRVAISGFAQPEDLGDDARRGRFKRWTARRFDAHFVPVPRLLAELRNAGYNDARAEMAGPFIAYGWGRLAASGPGGASAGSMTAEGGPPHAPRQAPRRPDPA